MPSGAAREPTEQRGRWKELCGGARKVIHALSHVLDRDSGAHGVGQKPGKQGGSTSAPGPTGIQRGGSNAGCVPAAAGVAGPARSCSAAIVLAPPEREPKPPRCGWFASYHTNTTNNSPVAVVERAADKPHCCVPHSAPIPGSSTARSSSTFTSSSVRRNSSSILSCLQGQGQGQEANRPAGQGQGLDCSHGGNPDLPTLNSHIGQIGEVSDILLAIWPP